MAAGAGGTGLAARGGEEYGALTDARRQRRDPAGAATAGGTGPAGQSRAAAGAVRGIFAGVVVAASGAYAAVTAAPVVAHDITGSAFLAGLPVAAMLAGAGAGATGVTALIRRSGHQVAFTATYLLGAGGCLLALLAVVRGSFALLLAGVVGIGVGQASNQLARYAAAELYPEERRASVIGWVVWGLALGAVLGPLLLSPGGRLAGAAGAPVEGGGFLVGVGLFAVAAAFHRLGPRYRTASGPPDAPGGGDDTGATVSPWTLPNVQIAVATMVTCLVVMLLVMTVTPVHVHGAGHGLGTVGAIMSAHTLGMFGLAPIAGRLTARFGSVPVILAGVAVLVLAAAGGAAAPPASRIVLGAALFALGFGWCLGFVAASAMLASGVDAATRVRLQGRVESITWLSGAGAAVGSGLLLGLVGYGGVNLAAGGLLLVPVLVVARHAFGGRSAAGVRAQPPDG